MGSTLPTYFVGLLVVAIGCGVLGYFIGSEFEYRRWQDSTMGDLCETGRHPWACHLHPACEMQALVCFTNPKQIMREDER